LHVVYAQKFQKNPRGCGEQLLFFWLISHGITLEYLHGGSIKSKPNSLCHIYLMPDRIILKLSR